MVMNMRTKIMLGVLVALLLYFLYDSGMFSSKGGSSRPQKLAIDNVAAKSGGGATEDVALEIALVGGIEWDGKWKDDPFYYIAPETLKAGPKKGLVDKLLGSAEMGKATNMDLTGISWHGNSGYAIINGNIAKVGDKISGYTVEKIALTYVVLGKGRQTIRLSLE